MARQKKHSRFSGERTFTDPRKAASFVRGLMEQGARADYGTRHAMNSIGIQPHHYIDRSSTKKMPDAEAENLAQETDDASGEVQITKSPMATSNPQDPRTAASGYDPVTQRLKVEWGDGGTPYYYYDVTPQEADMFMNQVDSPGRFINAVLNGKNYGPVA
jgi:hypothetical protein